MDRETVLVPLIGWVHLTNEVTTPFGIGHPENTGTTSLVLVSLDADENELSGSHALLESGESMSHYSATAGAVAIGAGAVFPKGTGPTPDDVSQVTYDLPVG